MTAQSRLFEPASRARLVMAGTLAGIDLAPTATRSFLSAFFLLLATPLLLLPAIHMDGTVSEEWTRGLVTMASGIAILWLGVLRPDHRLYRAAHLAAGLPQVAAGVVVLAEGRISPGTGLIVCGVMASLLGPDAGMPNRPPSGVIRGDLLTLVLTALIAQLGVISMAGGDLGAALAAAGLAPTPFGLLMVLVAGLAFAAMILGLRRTAIVLVLLTAAVQACLLLLVAALVTPTVLLVSGSNVLIIGALALYPWRGGLRFDWSSLQSVLTAAFVTAATLPVMADIALNHTLDTRTSDLLFRQAQFAAVSLLLLAAFAAGPFAARSISRPIAALATQLAHVGRGEHAEQAMKPPFSELVAVADAIGDLAAELELERARGTHLIEDLQANNLDLERATAAKDEFLGLVSHELRTPITSITGNLALALRRPLPEGTDGLLDDALHEADRLTGIIDNLLLIAQVDAGVDNDTEPVLLDHVVRAAVSWLNRRHPEVEVQVRGEHRVVLEASEAYLSMVVRNYLSNAAKYGGPGQVLLTIEVAGDEAVVTVADRGPGIRPEDRERIFNTFFRAEATATHASGIGVGLAVCSRVVEAMGGRCWVEARDGGGSVFGFTIPTARTEDEEPVDPAPARPGDIPPDIPVNTAVTGR